MSDLRLILIVVVLLAALAPVVALSVRFRARRKLAEHSARENFSRTQALEGEAGFPQAGDPSLVALTSPSPIARIAGAALMALACVVAAGFILLVLPQGSVDRIAGLLTARTSTAPPQERISFLYLGDEISGSAFRLRGVVRNITTSPIERLDAVIRLYAPSGQLVETRSVRMDSERIGPDATAQFHLVYPDYRGQFGSYSVEFVLRDGEALAYKDLRGVRGRE